MAKFLYTEHKIYKVKLEVGKGYNTIYFSSNNREEIEEFLENHYSNKTWRIKSISGRAEKFVVTKDLIESRQEKLKKIIIPE